MLKRFKLNIATLMKNFFNLLFILTIALSCQSTSDNGAIELTSNIDVQYLESIHEKGIQLADYIALNKSKNYNDSIAILINFKAPSGRYRFFLYDLKNASVIDYGLVTHGSGSVLQNSDELQFLNVENSLATSLGKYKMGKSYFGDFGKAYKMHGLDKTNDKAFERFIVFHAHECVPDRPINGELCLSWGCPTVSPQFFNKVAKILDASSKAILMEIFYK